MPPPGMQLFVQATANVAALVPDGTGGLVFRTSAVQLAATPLPMFFADTGQSGSLPCRRTTLFGNRYTGCIDRP